MTFLLCAAVFCTAALSAMGVGGGSLLPALLALLSDLSPGEIRFTNLALFLPAAALSLLIQGKRGLLNKEALLLSLSAALPGALLGLWIASSVSPGRFRRFFALFLLAVGVHELFASKKDP